MKNEEERTSKNIILRVGILDSIKEIMDTTNTVIMLLSAASGKLSNVPTEHSTSFISIEREEKTMALLL